jgi:uncharacterized protein
MMKLLVLLLVVGVLGWLLWGRSRRPGAERRTPKPPPDKAPAAQAMVACAHCGVHLPQADALTDAAGRPFCSEAHRVAGPR